jgi:hypothetical protein
MLRRPKQSKTEVVVPKEEEEVRCEVLTVVLLGIQDFCAMMRCWRVSSS